MTITREVRGHDRVRPVWVSAGLLAMGLIASLAIYTVIAETAAPVRRTIDVKPAAVTRVTDLEVTNQIQMTNTSGPKILAGTGDPSGVLSAPIGSLRTRTDTARLYQNIDGATAWAPFESTLIGVQRFTGEDGTYTPTAGTRRVHLRMTGGGGGGGAAQGGGVGTASFGGGGASGTYLERWIVSATPVTGGPWTGAGAGGGGGINGTGAGAPGPDATILINGVLYTAKGGPGGGGMASATTPATTAPAWQASDTSGPADFISAGVGLPGERYTNGIGIPGVGGSNPFGYGGAVATFPGAGGNGQGYGAGGGGAIAWTVDLVGGNGAATLIIVVEYSR